MRLQSLTIVVFTLFLLSGISYAGQTSSDMPGTPQFAQPGAPEHNPVNRQKHRDDFARRLNLTEQQKQMLDAKRKADMEEIKPVLNAMFAKRQEYESVSKSTTLTPIEKEAKLLKLKSEMKELKIKADAKRNENMKNFEEILTPEQKTEFQKIKAEHKENMEKMKQNPPM